MTAETHPIGSRRGSESRPYSWETADPPSQTGAVQPVFGPVGPARRRPRLAAVPAFCGGVPEPDPMPPTEPWAPAAPADRTRTVRAGGATPRPNSLARAFYP